MEQDRRDKAPERVVARAGEVVKAVAEVAEAVVEVAAVVEWEPVVIVFARRVARRFLISKVSLATRSSARNVVL